MLIAAVVSPRGAPGTNARLERHGAIVTRAAGDIAPHDAVAAFHRIAQNIGALAGDLLHIPARLVTGYDWQRVAVAQRAVPAMHVGTTEGRSGNFYQQ